MQATLKGVAPALAGGVRRMRSNSVVHGAAVVLVVAAALVAAGAVYVHPLGRKTISFATTDAASLAAGEDVRVAGISVGKVSGLSIGPDVVRVDLSIDDSTFVGSESTIDVRMLTPVGGYAVTVISDGERPLAPHQVIPADRVRVPYSIADVLQAAPHMTDRVDGGTIDANIDQIATALQHDNTSIKSIIDGLNSIAAVLDRQREQVHTIMDFSAEYLRAFNGSRDFIFDLLRRVDIVVSTYDAAKAGFDETYERLGDILFRVTPLLKFYLEHKDELSNAITGLRDAIGDLRTNLGPALDNMTGLRERLQNWLGPEGLRAIGGGALLASDICVPTPGRTC